MDMWIWECDKVVYHLMWKFTLLIVTAESQISGERSGGDAEENGVLQSDA